MQMELLGFLNVVQLIFIGIRLDGITQWRWVVSESVIHTHTHNFISCCFNLQLVLIPTWVLLAGMLVFIMIYACLQCYLISMEENQLDKELRKPLVATNIISFFLSTVSFTLFLVSHVVYMR